MIQSSKKLCKLCFEVLISKLTGIQIPKFPLSIQDSNVPLFVTWTLTKNSRLRGCIGTFQPKPLSISLPQFAIISALKDSRFKPITLEEVQNLTVEVSLLGNFQKIESPIEWQVGKHGITIQFQVNKTKYRSTFLPEVAQQQGWSQEETITELIEKAGYNGQKANIKNLTVTTYQSSKAYLSYSEYLQIIKNDKNND